MRLHHILSFASIGALSLALTGCGSSFVSMASDPDPSPLMNGKAFSGSSMGGQQPIGTSRLYIFAADSTAYGHAAVSLIKADPSATYPSQLDSNGNYYITTGYPGGGFNFDAGQYQCSVGQQVYLYSVGGDVGNGQNSAISEMAILGTCGASTPSGFSQLSGNFVYMNEVSTVAAAYSLAGFATDATHIASGPSTLASVGITNAFNTAPNLYNINGGAAQGALAVTPAGNGTVPQAEINSLADMLASCINSAGATSTNCTTLLSNAKSGGTTGTTPTDTSSATINIAHNPGANVGNLFALFTNTSPFQPTLSVQPNDYSLIVGYADGAGPTGLAIDGGGSVWVTNLTAGTVTKLSSNGTVLSGSGFTDANMGNPDGIAIDAAGNAWISDDYDALIEISTDGTRTASNPVSDLSGIACPGVAIDKTGNIWVGQEGATSAVQFAAGPGFTAPTEITATSGGGYRGGYVPGSIAVDSSSNVYAVNYKNSSNVSSISKFNSSGTALSSSTGYGSTLSQQNGEAIALDASNNLWMTNQKNSSITVLSSAGTNVGTGLAAGASSAGVLTPQGIAFDGSGNAWVSNTGGTLSVLTSAGTAVTSSHGYSGTTYNVANGYAMAGIGAIAVDGSGNVWVADHSNANIYELVGAATPVVTPIVAGLSGSYTPASKP